MKKGFLVILAILIPVVTLAQGVFGDAQWIGVVTQQQGKTPEDRSIILQRDFQPTKAIRKAVVYVCGLGFYELTINGQKVGDAEFAPLWSDYNRSVFYNIYEINAPLSSLSSSSLSSVPAICIQVLLGNGFYNEQGKRYHKLKTSFGPLTLLFRLHIEYQDGSEEDVVSDKRWLWTESPITFNSIYGGEDYDARLEVRDRWKPVVIQTAPKGVLRQQIAQPVKIMERYAVKDTIRRDSILVLDMGQNLAGFPEITVEGKAGQWLKLTPGETLNKEGFVNQKQTGRPHYYTYILKGNSQKPIANSQKPETWHPRFSYYSFRYLQVEGDIDVLKKVESCFVYNSAPRIASFECSNPLINDTHRLIDRAIRSNWQSVWTDCPAREKLGWLEQDWLNGEALVYNYDCRAMLEQTMQNIADAQHDDGSMPEIAPEYTVFKGSWAKPFQESPEWGGAIIALPHLYLKHYGDSLLVKRYYPQMKRYVDYLATQDSCYILRQGLGDWYDYGPGRAGFSQNTPMPLVSTAHYYWWNKLMQEPRADSIKAAFIREFYHPETRQFGNGSQCANAIALYMGLVPEGERSFVLQNLVDDIHVHGDRLTTGDVGNRYLFYTLVDNGYRELLYAMLNHYDVPGYGYQIKKGQTTLTEQWNPEHGASMNHFMMGHIENLLIPDLLGINIAGDSIHIAPHPVSDLAWCKGSVGDIKTAWKQDNGTFILDVDIPQGRQATVTLPYSNQRQYLGEGHHTLRDK